MYKHYLRVQNYMGVASLIPRFLATEAKSPPSRMHWFKARLSSIILLKIAEKSIAIFLFIIAIFCFRLQKYKNYSIYASFLLKITQKILLFTVKIQYFKDHLFRCRVHNARCTVIYLYFSNSVQKTSKSADLATKTAQIG